MQIFFFRSHSTSNMSLLFIDLQHAAHFFCQCRINQRQSVCTVFMYRTLTNSKFLCRLSYRCVIFYDITSDLYGSFFNIILQKNPLQTSFYNVCRKRFLYSKKRRNSRSDAIKSGINPSYRRCLYQYQLEDQLLTKVRRRVSNILRM